MEGLRGYEAVVQQEVEFLDGVVAGSYAGFRDFPRMVALSLFYFATAIWSEQRRREERTPRPFLCSDDAQLQHRLAQCCAWIADPLTQAVLITGGTGFTARDNTPQAVAPLLDKAVDGFGELFRQVSRDEIGSSTIQSRALAGISNGTLVCCLPGSPGACRTAWEKILREQLDSRTRPCNFVPHLKTLPEQPALACGSRA